jgi:hypothetical protein
MDEVSTQLDKDIEQYDRFVKESDKITNILRKKVESGKKKMFHINYTLKLLYYKFNGAIIDHKKLHSSIGEALLSDIFTESTWRKRHIHYIKILNKNKIDMKLFKSQINSDNILDTHKLKHFYYLSKVKELLTSQLNNERCFFKKC